MKNSKGRVRKVLVSDWERFKELLIRSLIKYNISYLQIDNEFHFFDKIFRFYDFDMANKLINDGVEFFGQEDDVLRIFVESDLLFSKTKEDIENIFLSSDDIQYYEEKEEVKINANKSIPAFSKKKVKRDNYMLKQKIKHNKR